MSCELTILPGTRIVLLRLSGPVVIVDLRKSVARGLKLCRENDIREVILDSRQQIDMTTTMEMFDFATTVPKQAPGFRFAFVHDPDDMGMRFVSNVAANRGALTCDFATIEKAQKWLESIEPTLNKPKAGEGKQIHGVSKPDKS